MQKHIFRQLWSPANFCWSDINWGQLATAFSPFSHVIIVKSGWNRTCCVCSQHGAKKFWFLLFNYVHTILWEQLSLWPSIFLAKNWENGFASEEVSRVVRNQNVHSLVNFFPDWLFRSACTLADVKNLSFCCVFVTGKHLCFPRPRFWQRFGIKNKKSLNIPGNDTQRTQAQKIPEHQTGSAQKFKVRGGASTFNCLPGGLR